jgi:hypothetical protein
MTIRKYKYRYWAVYDADEVLVCVCVYRKGAREVVRRLAPSQTPGIPHDAEPPD